MAKMIGKHHPRCACCTDEKKKTAVRRIKRRERQAWKKEVR